MEDSPKTAEQENEALIEEMLRDTKTVDLPTELTREPVIHKGDETLDAPMVGRVISSAGYVYVWDTRTFEKIPILYYMLPSKLRLKREDGSYRFTTIDPKRKPERGTLKCWLHKDDPNRAHYDELGFAVCKKGGIRSPYQVTQHMKKKHPQEFAAIEDERKERERQEDRELQRLILKQAVPQTVGTPEAPLYVSKKDRQKD